MTILAARSFLAQAALYAVFATFVAYAAYGVYLDVRAGRYRIDTPPRRDPWNPAYYRPGAEPWLARNRRWARWRNWVWIGTILAGNALYVLLEP